MIFLCGKYYQVFGIISSATGFGNLRMVDIHTFCWVNGAQHKVYLMSTTNNKFVEKIILYEKCSKWLS